jgi:leucyl aminopeptidase
MLKVRIGAAMPLGAFRVVPVAEGDPVPEGLHEAAAAEGFTGTTESCCICHPPEGPVLLVGTGRAAALREAGAVAASRLLGQPRMALDASALAPDAAAAFIEGACLRAWHYERLKTRAGEGDPRLHRLDVVTDAVAQADAIWQERRAAVRGNLFARNLVAEPANTLTPEGFVERLDGLEKHGIAIDVLRRHDLAREGLGALLAVGRGSVHAPRLVLLRWKGRMDAPPVAFVGKGITFDTGGISIKPAAGMEHMRADMAGAAACAGAMLALALRRSPAPAVAVLALAENTTGAASYRPGDVLRSYSGRSIEVIDTDAEGRLVLADALAWTARRQKPLAMIDLATLTGSIVTALGHHMAGLFANSPLLATELADAGAESGERLWEMPIGETHREDLRSDIADLKQCASGRFQPDACHAAAFLREFAGDVPWAHLDIAGVGLTHETCDLHAAGPTGFGVRLLDRLVARHFEDPERAAPGRLSGW